LSDKTAEEAKLLALNIIRRAEKAVLFAVEGRERDHFVFAGSDKLALNMRDLVPVVSSLVKAKGGGSASLVELVADKVDLRAVLAAAEEYLKENSPLRAG
jgi:alanyl-tRNA synthetase